MSDAFEASEDLSGLLYHYTNFAGLKGILESQQLWATGIRHLNDVEEHTWFFERRLPHLCEAAVKDFEAAVGVKEFTWMLCRKMASNLDRPSYLTSFCCVDSEDEARDGLLSQWRGYGTGGGYAIVFRRKGLEQLLLTEGHRFGYADTLTVNVEYCGSDGNPIEEVTVRREASVKSVLRDIYDKWRHKEAIDVHDVLPMVGHMTALACTHKHRGFKEEKEVRIVAIPWQWGIERDIEDVSVKRRKTLPPRKDVQFRERDGFSVPYITLFGREVGEKREQLPIVRVIVGPHRDMDARLDTVQCMLQQRGIEAEVTKSGIPFLGR